MRNVVSGGGLVLREFVPQDVDAVVRIASTPGFNFYALALPTADKSEIRASAERLVTRAIDMQQPTVETGVRENFKLAVAEVTNPKKLIGYVALDEINEKRGEQRDVGYFIDPACQGRGYAVAASRLILGAFFDATPYDLVQATVHPNNHSSRSVLARLGYKEVGEKTTIVRGEVEPRIKLTLHRLDFIGNLPDATRPKGINISPVATAHI